MKKLISDFNADRELKKYAPLLQEEAKGLSADSLVDLIYNKKWERFFWIKQLSSEIKSLMREVESLTPRVVVEIGTNMGGTLFLATKVADVSAHIISIDLPGGRGGGGYPDYRETFYRSFVIPPQRMDIMRVDSHAKSTYDDLVALLDGNKIDYLFLDGDHSLEGIKMDFEMYAPLVRSGGLVAFHDIKPSLPDNWIQVGSFWESIKNKYNYREYLDRNIDWGGIGTLTMP